VEANILETDEATATSLALSLSVVVLSDTITSIRMNFFIHLTKIDFFFFLLVRYRRLKENFP